MDPRSPTTTLLVVGLLAVVIFGSLVIILNTPRFGGENSPGHVVWHVIVGGSILLTAFWFYQHRQPRTVRDALRQDPAPTIAWLAFVAWGIAQLFTESVGAYVWWAHGDEFLHDLAVLSLNFAAEIVLALSLLAWGITTVVRRVRRGSYPAPAR